MSFLGPVATPMFGLPPCMGHYARCMDYLHVQTGDKTNDTVAAVLSESLARAVISMCRRPIAVAIEVVEKRAPRYKD